MLQHALQYRAMGLSVIPVKPNSKIPATKWLEYQLRLPSIDEINEWWGGENPLYNIGIVTGAISGIVVIDCDSPSAITAFLELYKGDAPRVRTPRGMHFFFKYEEGMRNSVRVAGYDLDIRADGGYVVAPPSIINNKIYKFIKPIKSISIIPNIDSNVINALSINNALITNNNINNNTYNKEILNNNNINNTEYFILGRRDNDLFHVANCLIKGQCAPDLARQVLEIIGQSCNPPFPQNELYAKIQSAIARAELRDRNLSQEVRDWVKLTKGHFYLTDAHNDLHILTKQEKHNLEVILSRLADEGVIERYGSRRGCYRLVCDKYETLDIGNAPTDCLDFKAPLGIMQHCRIFPKNVILVSGLANQGKSAMAFELARLNRYMFPDKVRFMTSEAGDTEIRDKLLLYPQDNKKGTMHLDWWLNNVEFIPRFADWQDLINPDGLNVIDYISDYVEAYKIPHYWL